MKVKKRRTLLRILAGVLLCIVALAPQQAAAAQAYPGYTYNSKDQAVPTAMPYEALAVYSGDDFEIGAFSMPSDLYTTESGDVFLLDAKNSRIVVLNADITLNRVITPRDPQGQDLQFVDAAGISVCDDGRLLVCDRKGQAVYVLDATGAMLDRIERPVSGIVPDNFQFQPVKAEEDSGGILYVLSAGSYNGALQFDRSGEFLGFYGSEDVDLTLDVLISYFWKNVLSAQAAEGLSRTVPVEFVSFCIDEKDFVFTIRKGNEVTTGQVRKLNAKGENVLEEHTFGDHIKNIQLVDLNVDAQGFITVLDGSSGRLLQYDPDGQLLYAFAGKGTQLGTFTTPAAVASVGDRLLVLDTDTGLLTVFAPTEFALQVRQATTLYRDGRYAEAMEPWQQVLTRDNNYELANIGMGKIYEGLGQYETAMDYYSRGNDRQLYSDAFTLYRAQLLRQHFTVLMLLIAAGLVALMVFLSKPPRRREVYAGGRPRGKYPMYCMLHPFNGYSDLKSERSGSLWRANVILVALFVVSVLTQQLTGFPFNDKRTDQLNLWVCLCSSVGVFVAFVACNWAVTTIMDGKGSFREIWIFCAYALVPYVLLSLGLIVLSNVLSSEEAAFYYAAQGLTYAWTAIALLVAIREVHMYSLKKTLGTLLITFFGLVVVVIIAAIIFSVFSQLVGFIATIGSELSMRS